MRGTQLNIFGFCNICHNKWFCHLIFSITLKCIQYLYQCYAFLNSYPFSDTEEINKNLFIARNYLEAAVEICLLSNMNIPGHLDENGLTCGTIPDGPNRMQQDGGVGLPPVVNEVEKPSSDPLECRSDCNGIITNSYGEVVYENPACLSDCWTPSCFSYLMNDLNSSVGVCAGSYGDKSGMEVSSTPCIINQDYEIWEGLCSQETEEKLMEDSCYYDLQRQDQDIRNTLLFTVLSMCSYEVYDKLQRCPSLIGQFGAYFEAVFKIEQCETNIDQDATITININSDTTLLRSAGRTSQTEANIKLYLVKGSDCIYGIQENPQQIKVGKI